ncbi:hypothetical protein BWI17_18915 [Betaproteobacteria bacterium GR16-43]|nr:hypothetical protein BWI17_18915 [Betaproteobacteria bacterium GR16-43]
MAATDEPQKGGALAALLQAALALPVLALPVRAAAADVGEIGFAVLGYKERGLMKISEPLAWARVEIGDNWTLSGSALVDIITGASPELVSNESGSPMRTVTGASISDRRTAGDVKLTRRFGGLSLSASRAVSNEEDYRSRAFGLEAALELEGKLTTFNAGYGKSNDRVRSADDPLLDERRDTKEYLLGATQVLSPTDVVQSTLQWSRGKGYYNDPYKGTLTFYPGADLPVLLPDTRPSSRNSLAWLTRLRHHVPGHGTLQASYRYFHDDWGISAHTFEVAWEAALSESWSLRPALRYYTQSSADFYGRVVPQPPPEALSSDQRLAAFGGLSPSLRATWRWESLTFEATAGYYYNAANLRPGGGEAGFVPLRAYYGLASVVKTF